jgi:hypothetical protein
MRFIGANGDPFVFAFRVTLFQGLPHYSLTAASSARSFGGLFDLAAKFPWFLAH